MGNEKFGAKSQYTDGSNLYQYVSSNSVSNIDFMGLKKVCGPNVWIWTGYWCVDEDVWDQAMDEAAMAILDQTVCWWSCVVKGNKCCSTAIGSALSITYTHLPFPKTRGQVPKGSGYATLMSQASYFLKKHGCKAIGQKFRTAARTIKGAKLGSGVAVIAKGAIAGEAILSVYCSYTCASR